MKRAILRIYFLLRAPVIWMVGVLGGFCVRKPAGRYKILLIRLDRLGDLVLTLPVIESLRRHYPDAEIALLVRPYLAGLSRLIQAVDTVIAYDGFFSTVRVLRRTGFTVAIDMLNDYSVKPALLAIASGAPTRVGFAGGFRELLFTHVVRPGAEPRHMVAINLEALKVLDVPAVGMLPQIRLERAAKGSEVIVAIHPGGHYPSQRWNVERFALVAVKIAETYRVKLLILGGPGDKAAVDYIAAAVSEQKAETVIADLKGLTRALASASLVICNNSGPLHLAAALGVPTVSTMGPTDPILWWPQGPDQIVVRKELVCSPCGAGTCAKHECMDAITVEEVFEKAGIILDRIDGIKRH